MPNNPLTSAELQAYSINPTGIPQMPAGYFLASPVSGTGPFAYRLFDASYISIGIIDPNRLGTGSTGAGTRYLADDGTWKLVSSISLPTPTLAQVTTAGNTTTNAITIGGLTVATNLISTDTVNGRVGIGTISPSYRLDVQGTTLETSSVSVQGAFNINPLAAPPVIGGFTLSAGTNLGVGTYYYFVTYVTALGETNAGSILTVTTTTGNTTVNLTGIPVSSDPRVTARKIYRTRVGQTSDAQRFLATINDNVTTTYTDSATDASLTGVALQYYKVNTTARYFTVGGVQGMVIDNNLTALGRNAGNAIIASSGSAIRTVLIGADAGKSITTGQANVIVGVAGGSLTTGNSNSLFGDLAGYNLTIGYGNTIVGSQTGRFLTSGYRNTFIGENAGSYLADGTTQVTTAFHNTAIGRNTRLSTINDSYSIIIGDTALGLGSNTTVIGNSSTTFTSIPAGNMTVGGTSNAGYKLDVNGTARVQSSLTVTSLTTDGPVVSNSGVLNSVAGYTGMVTIQQPAPLPPVTFDIQNGIIVNVL